MAANDTASMALFCDFENIALGVRDAQYEKFDIRPVLERLLAKGSIVVKKAYCDWDRYKSFKAAMHEANFELIEIPHVRQSGKNSADIRMVVDALDLCYTKSHVDTFVIISGDSDFSPLVSKLRENAKKVIGVGVKQSCSDLLVTNCDEFIYYDDLVRDREAQRGGQRREREKRSPEEEAKRREKMEERKAKAVDLVCATFSDLMADRGEAERIWASVLKEVVKRRNPGFSESYYGYRTFGNLLEEAASRGLLLVGRDDKSGTYVTRARPQDSEPVVADAAPEVQLEAPETPAAGETEAVAAPVEEKSGGRRRGGRRTRKDSRPEEPAQVSVETVSPVAEPVSSEPPQPAPVVIAETTDKPKRGARRPRKAAEAVVETTEAPAATPLETVAAAEEKKPARKTTRSRKPKKADGAKKSDESAG
ncbi:NYN domain-containing protein [Azonexus hydrophilus]|uniref:NYN domain-containing protein n=1 Tax=Azonexus hydrophilus TaxID=418702 RepID=A0ABZ2XLS8_9RHOO|nr:NYN domain-containing protein [Azonexus hydrophilus]